MASNRDWTETVRKLLANAEDMSLTEAARTAFATQAERLIIKHGIDVALLDAKKGKQEAIENRTIAVRSPYKLPKRALLFGICHALQVRAIYFGRRDDVTVIGFPSDLDALDLLWASLSLQAVQAVEAEGKLLRGDSPGESKSLRHNFWLGFAGTVSRRMEETYLAARQEAMQEAARETNGTTGTTGATGADLVLVDRKRQVDAFTSEMFPKLTTGRTPTVTRRDACGLGNAAGRRANIGQTGIGSNVRALPR